MSREVKPFRIAVADDVLDDLKSRLRKHPLAGGGDGRRLDPGHPAGVIEEVCRYWADDYDWRAARSALNRFAQFTTEIDGLDIHFLHVRSPHADALPLVITHGWPGSIVEFHKVIEPLTDPTAHGGDAADAFHVVCPSLPGYGFSDKPTTTGWGVERIAAAWAELMARLGYDALRRAGRRLGLGGDHGASARSDAEHCAGIHLNMAMRRRPAGGRRADARGGAARSRASSTTPTGTPATPSSSRPGRRPSATAWPTRRPARPRGSSRSSGPGPTATAIPRTCSAATSCSTT